MLSDIIYLTDKLIEVIRVERRRKKMTAEELADVIGRKRGFIYALEDGRVKKIERDKLISLFVALYDTATNEAELKIKNIIDSKEIDSRELDNHSTTDTTNNNNNNVTDNEKPIAYDLKDEQNYNNPELAKDIMTDIVNILNAYYMKYPERAIMMLNIFKLSLKFDMGFMTALLRLPFVGLEPLSVEERLSAFKEIRDVYKKHYDKAQSKLHEKTETE